jgi:hypothetical protein
MLQRPVICHSANPYPVSFRQDLEDLFFRRQCKHYVSEILQQGIIVADDLEQAVTRAIKTCLLAGLPVHRHFQSIYVCAGETQKDWLVSDLAFQLIVLNANAANSIIARMQLSCFLTNPSLGKRLVGNGLLFVAFSNAFLRIIERD